MVNKLIVSNILYRPVRTALSALAVAMEVAMVMLFVGLAHGLVNDSARRQEGVGADVMVQPFRIFVPPRYHASTHALEDWWPARTSPSRAGRGSDVDPL